MQNTNTFFKQIGLFIFLFTFLGKTNSQNTSEIVLMEGYDTLSMEQIPVLPDYDGSKGDVTYKAVSMKKYCPNPGNQGSIGSCSGWAVGFGAMTIHHAMQNKLTKKEDIQFNAFSPTFIYNQILKSQDCKKSVSMLDATKLLKEVGDCFLNDFNTGTNCSMLPDKKTLEKAANYKIQSAASLFNPGTNDEIKIDLIRAILADSVPVVVNIRVPKSFISIPYGNSFWQLSEKEVLSDQSHFMVITGYDDNKQSFELMNSWGMEWANKGFVNIPYKSFAPLCIAAYIIIPEYLKSRELLQKLENTKQKINKISNDYAAIPTLNAKFDFRKIVAVEPSILTETQKVIYDPNTQLYFLDKTQYVKDLYQIKVSDMSAGKYLYVFSGDSKNNVKLHFPKLSETQKTANFVPSQHTTLTIPGAQKALLAKEKGDDFIVILIADKEINNISEKIAQLSTYNKYNIQQKIRTIFNISDKNSPQYQKDKIAGTLPLDKSKNQGADILPLVLCVNIE